MIDNILFFAPSFNQDVLLVSVGVRTPTTFGLMTPLHQHSTKPAAVQKLIDGSY